MDDSFTLNSTAWLVGGKFEDLSTPKKIKLIKHINPKISLVEFENIQIEVDNKKLFKTFEKAEVFGIVNSIKLYNSFDTFFVISDVSDDYINYLIKRFEELQFEYPDLVLYFWMQNDQQF